MRPWARPPRPVDRLVAGRHLRRRLEVEVALVGKPLDESSSSSPSFACDSSSPSPRSASSISGVNWPLSISASRIAWRSASSERSGSVEVVEVRIEVLRRPRSPTAAENPRACRAAPGDRPRQQLRAELRVGVEAHISNIQPGRGACIIRRNAPDAGAAQ